MTVSRHMPPQERSFTISVLKSGKPVASHVITLGARQQVRVLFLPAVDFTYLGTLSFSPSSLRPFLTCCVFVLITFSLGSYAVVGRLQETTTSVTHLECLKSLILVGTRLLIFQLFLY